MNNFRDNETATTDRIAQNDWGMLAQFRGADELREAAKQLREDGYASLEAFTPFPVPGLGEFIVTKRSPMPLIILIGGLLGGSSIYGLEYWVNLYAYPINVGGRPLHSWPSFIPPAFEGTVLGASFAALIGLILVCRLPRLHHPLFEIEAFKRASIDGFFMAVKSDDAKFDREPLRTRLSELGGTVIWEVSHGD